MQVAEGETAVAAADDAPLETLERRVMVYWWLSGVLGSAMLAGLLLVGVLVARDRQFPYVDALTWAAATLVSLRLLWALVAPPLAFARWRYRVDDELLLMRYGILFHEERLVPVRRMQHIDLSRGPVERMFGLATLVVYTAGNEGSAFRVPGLAPATAQAMRDRVLRARGDDVL
jgi:membrane protein YdbS with pleckstrin-like domain